MNKDIINKISTRNGIYVLDLKNKGQAEDSVINSCKNSYLLNDIFDIFKFSKCLPIQVTFSKIKAI